MSELEHGDRVIPSPEGLEEIFRRKSRIGTVLSRRNDTHVTIQWDGYRSKQRLSRRFVQKVYQDATS
jgi:hypothetical protein